MIGERIKQARLALGYSAEQVAAFLHVSPATIYRYENGDISKLPSKHIKPLAEFLCVSPEYLMGWTEEEGSSDSDLPDSSDFHLFVRDSSQLTPDQFRMARSILRAAFRATNPDLFKGDDDK